MGEHLFRRASDDDLDHGRGGARGVPGKLAVTSKIMRSARDGNGVAAGADAAVDRASGTSGEALPGALRGSFEASLGADLSGVRVHTGDASAAAASSVGARAYATGQDIHFAAGQYDPSSAFGVHLIAHEVAHTVQQQGAAPAIQHKLEVSAPQDQAEVEADRAADAMVRGEAAAVSSATGVARKVHRDADVSVGTLQGAGDEAAATAMKAPMMVDTANVTADRGAVTGIVGDIDAQFQNIQDLEKEDKDVEDQKGAPLATNTSTRLKLLVLDNKLDVSAVDTTSFAVQYRDSSADFKRLIAEASECLAGLGAHSDDPLKAIGDGIANAPGMKLDASPAMLRMRDARRNMNTAAVKMDAQLHQCRTSGNLLQGAVYNQMSGIAAANGKDAATKLAAVRKEIEDVAKGVAMAVKVCTAVSGLAGGGGATNAIGTARAGAETGGAVTVEGGPFASGGQVLTPQDASRKELAGAMGKDLSSLMGEGGGPEKLAEKLVTLIGEHANKGKIANLQAMIAKAAAEEATYKASGDAQMMLGYQDGMETAAKQLALLVEAFASTKRELLAASQELMTELGKHGKQGKDQAKGVLFLTDADRFLAQVNRAIATGDNQQANLSSAAGDRKKLRGTNPGEDGEDRDTAKYFRCIKHVSPGRLWGTNTTYSLQPVRVEFRKTGIDDHNDVVQGGAGTIEGTGGAGDRVKTQLDVLKAARTKVTELQTKVQTSLGMGEAGTHA